MPILIDKTTRQRIVFSKNSGDIEYDLSGDEAIVTEDIPLIGNWTDYTGSGGVNSKVQLMASVENTLQGTDGQIDTNIKIPNLNIRGKNAQTHRSRIIKRYIENPNN